MDSRAVTKARETERLGVDQRCFIHDEIGREFSGRRPDAESVAGKPSGNKKAGLLRDL